MKTWGWKLSWTIKNRGQVEGEAWMKYACHKILAKRLCKDQLSVCSRFQKVAFSLGCVEPDFNPGTFLRGSLTTKWLGGHNFVTARTVISKLAGNLDQSVPSSVFDFYKLGKLIHYLVDSFTYPHNGWFTGTIREHMAYEKVLKKQFQNLMEHITPPAYTDFCGSFSKWIQEYHESYSNGDASMERDVSFSLTTSSYILGQCRKMMEASQQGITG